MILQRLSKGLRLSTLKPLNAFGGGDIRHKFPGEIKDEDFHKYDHIFQRPPDE